MLQDSLGSTASAHLRGGGRRRWRRPPVREAPRRPRVEEEVRRVLLDGHHGGRRGRDLSLRLVFGCIACRSALRDLHQHNIIQILS